MLLGIAPQPVADFGVEHLGEALGKAVGERLQKDVGIIVVGALEPLQVGLEPVNADRECANPVLALGIDEVGQAHVRPTLALLHLLAEHREPSPVVARQHQDVVALALGPPQTHRRLRSDPRRPAAGWRRAASGHGRGS